MRSSSPACTSFDRFTRSPATCTLPPSIASTARARVLKKRAAHSHLSRRTRPGVSCSMPAVRAGDLENARDGVRAQLQRLVLQRAAAELVEGDLVRVVEVLEEDVVQPPAHFLVEGHQVRLVVEGE